MDGNGLIFAILKAVAGAGAATATPDDVVVTRMGSTPRGGDGVIIAPTL